MLVTFIERIYASIALKGLKDERISLKNQIEISKDNKNKQGLDNKD